MFPKTRVPRDQEAGTLGVKTYCGCFSKQPWLETPRKDCYPYILCLKYLDATMKTVYNVQGLNI
jgi:hypothetical protein